MQVFVALIVVGVLLWLVNRFIPMAGSIKSILNAVVVICTVLWLLDVFGLFHSLSRIRVGTWRNSREWFVALTRRRNLCGRKSRRAGANLSWRWAMNESKQRVVKFLEKEIKTYAALSLYLSKKSTLESFNVRDRQALMHPAFYKERMKEAKKLVIELKQSN
jgi:hypothetical protein